MITAEIKYPTLSCVSPADKLEFCYIAQEKLRAEHNQIGTDFREGKITQEDWDLYMM
jgi:hypothetical protein